MPICRSSTRRQSGRASAAPLSKRGWRLGARDRTARCRSAARLREHARQICAGIFLLEPRIDLAREHPDAVHGVVVFEEARLAHDQEMAVAADMVIEFLDLLVDLIR